MINLQTLQVRVKCTVGGEQTMDSWEGHVMGHVTLPQNLWLVFTMWPALCVDLSTTLLSQVLPLFFCFVF